MIAAGMSIRTKAIIITRQTAARKKPNKKKNIRRFSAMLWTDSESMPGSIKKARSRKIWTGAADTVMKISVIIITPEIRAIIK